jgi:CzcA family heavy metal efflux pump
MLNALIRFSLRHRPIILAACLLLLVTGAQVLRQLPVEVLPDLTKPTVTILTEAPGLAPEEVENLVTLPIESAVQGVGGVDRLRSNSDVGLSLVFVEFAWGTEIHRARQWVQERLQAALANLPDGVEPGLTPVSSLMGEILLVGLRDPEQRMRPMDLRTLADSTLRRRLQSIPGVAEVLAIGGGVKQIQVRPDPQRLAAFDVTLAELEAALADAARNTTGGYLLSGAREIMVRNLAMTTDLDALARTVVKSMDGRPVTVADLAEVGHGVQPMRGDASVNGRPGVVLSVDKAPGFDTLRLTDRIEAALEELRPSLPPGLEVEILFRQGEFIRHAIHNLQEAIRDGAVMVTLVLFLFLLNFRTTFITLTAIPLSFALTVLVFRLFDVSVNAMTLGGLAVAIGMVVDDAIVDVENVYRRLRENAVAAAPRPRLEVIATASGEVRNSILYATVLIILVFLPLLGLQGIEGRLFQPIAIATMVSMAASFLVSLTVIPVLCSLLLRPREGRVHGDGPLVRALKRTYRATWLNLALRQPLLVLGVAGVLAAWAVSILPSLGREFLPAFNEGSAVISLAAAPGTSLRQSNAIGEVAVELLRAVPEVRSVGRRAGRAERDDHVMPVSVNEFDVEFHAEGRPRAAVFEDIRNRLATLPGTVATLGQPIGHRLSHMLSGVSAKIAIKLYGPDLDTLRQYGKQIEALARGIPGLTDVGLEPQVPIPQLRIEVDRDRALAAGATPGAINAQLATLLGGRPVAELREGVQTVDLVLQAPDSWRDSPERLRELPIEIGEGRRLPLGALARVAEASGPNVINRENGQRRVVVAANTRERDLQTLVLRLQQEIAAEVKLPDGGGYFIRFEGEFQAQQAAAKRIGLLSLAVLAIIAFLLYGYFGTPVFALQVLADVPLALIGGLLLTWRVVDNISIATLVGFIAVAGVAARNSIMLISHYLHLMRHEGEPFSRALVERGTLERLVPVLMTALSAGIALVPLVLASGDPGKEILHPVAVVICGGLITSTFLGLGVTPAVFQLFGRAAAEKAVRTQAPATQ